MKMYSPPSTRNEKDVTSWMRKVADLLSLFPATKVEVTPHGAISSTNVQAALEELDTEKLAVSNGVVTVSGTNLGFHGKTPIAQAVLPAGAGKTVDEVITALQNLGLVKQV